MKLYVIRHGQTNWNIENRLQGQVESVLTEQGIEQIKRAKEKLKHIQFDYIICSPLQRCKDTVQIVNEDKNIPVIYDERLKERSYGKLEGAYDTEIDIKMLWDIKSDYKDKNVESVNEFLNRVYSFLKEIENKYKNKKVLLSTHFGNMVAIDCYYNGIPEDKNLLKFGFKNGEVSICGGE